MISLLLLATMAQDPTPRHTEVDAVGWAFEALLKYPAEERPYIRFVYLPSWADPEWIGVVDFAVNCSASHARTLIRGDRHAGGWLLAYNLRQLAPEHDVQVKLIAEWDGLAVNEFRFHVPDIDVVETKRTVQERDRFGRVTTREVVDKSERKIAILAPHLQDALARHRTDETRSERLDVLVTQLTRSTGGIYPADFLIEQLLTSLRGRYPEFRQMAFAAKDDTPLVAHLKKRGFYVDASIEAKGDKGAVQLISDVTGKNRLVLSVFGLASRTPAWVTYDLKDANRRPDAQFIRNLLTFDESADASEVFIPLPNGMVEFVLADGKGNLQRSAPPDVVADSTKPDGHTKELEMGMSCVICHAPRDGYQPVRNDLELLLGSSTDFFGDDISVKGVKLGRQQVLDIIIGRYTEPLDEPDGLLGRSRRDYIRAVGQLTGYEVEANEPSAVAKLGEKLKSIYHTYRYQRIDADRACLELGVPVAAGGGRAMLTRLVPPPAAGETEDVIISMLRAGAVIKRDDFEAIYVELARRAMGTRKSVLATKEQGK